ncbi:MAG: hypothetical protein A2231_09060 [Candidatus Firestonebacteria bacterium RIFOXYA2_FULL_40_8]|nr:MAG: hypothetical protein A2231_09060 [Candidatus Firestonebacteria bacterium RIFOXYA2_FULL_40_8]
MKRCNKLKYFVRFIIFLSALSCVYSISASGQIAAPNIDPSIPKAELLRISLHGSSSSKLALSSVGNFTYLNKYEKQQFEIALDGLINAETYSLFAAVRSNQYWDTSFWFISPMVYFENSNNNFAGLVLGIGQWFSKYFQADIGPGVGMTFPAIEYLPIVMSTIQVSEIEIFGGRLSEKLIIAYPYFVDSSTKLEYSVANGLSFSVSLKLKQTEFKDLRVFYILGFGFSYQIKT